MYQTNDQSNELKSELAYLRSSREFMLGMRLRQSALFKLVRHVRFKNLLVKILVSGMRQPESNGSQVCLAGVWDEGYPTGMPLELVERSLTVWQTQALAESPYGLGLLTSQEDTLVIYSRDEKLRLDFCLNDSSGQIQIQSAAGSRTIDLYAVRPGIVSVYPNRAGIEVVRTDEFEPPTPSSVSRSEAARGSFFTPADQVWLEQQQSNPRPLSLNHPEWRGILAASRQLFNNVFTIPDNLDRSRAAYFARLILESGAPSLTIQGFPLSYAHLVKALHKAAPNLPVFAIYHGNYLHVREDYDWNSFKTIKALHDEGLIQRVGFVKLGMAEVMAATGMRCAFIMNLVRRLPEGPSPTQPGLRQIGVWGQPDWSWKKPPYAMLAALTLVPDAQAQVYNVSPRAQEYGSLLGLSAEYYPAGVPQELVPETMGRMHLNLYVTLTECAPMMPLESLSMGAPCLFGPNTPYFLDHSYLHERLVVPYPEQAEVIARCARLALDERAEIIQAYQAYAPEYNQRALAVLAEFLQTTRDQLSSSAAS